MTSAVYPGTFDPVTMGHLDIIKRAAYLYDSLTIGVLHNSQKTPLFSTEERVKILQKATKDIPNVKVCSFEGLSVDFARSEGAKVIVRGIRLMSDFEMELQMAQTNRMLAPDVDTAFLCTSLHYSYLSSTTVKEVAKFGGDISEFVPGFLVEEIQKKIAEKENKT